MSFQTPILFLIFNRPSTTQRVFEKIKEIKPKYLYIAADGPRTDKLGEQGQCLYTRQLVINAIDWDCEVRTLFRDENLGCGVACCDAINWFFNNVEQGIILEDDCFPDISFFHFCEKLLGYYKNENNVAMISGLNTFNKEDDYYFHYLGAIWGWATWRRAWANYKFHLKKSDLVKFKKIENKIIRKSFENTLIRQLNEEKFTWDIQWVNCILASNAFTISPLKNLIKNIGIEGTHTNGELSEIQKTEVQSIDYASLKKRTVLYDEKYALLNSKLMARNILSDNNEPYLVTKWNLLKRYLSKMTK